MKFLKRFIIPFLILLLALFIRYMLPHLTFLPEELHALIQTTAKILVIVAFGFTLMLFESVRNIGISLFASAGIAGLVLGLAAQKALGTILAGFQIAITQPIRLDDVVIVENEWGWIEEINLTYVVIRIWDNRNEGDNP